MRMGWFSIFFFFLLSLSPYLLFNGRWSDRCIGVCNCVESMKLHIYLQKKIYVQSSAKRENIINYTIFDILPVFLCVLKITTLCETLYCLWQPVCMCFVECMANTWKFIHVLCRCFCKKYDRTDTESLSVGMVVKIQNVNMRLRVFDLNL